MGMYETLSRVMQPKDRLKLACEACGHRAELTRKEAFVLFGAEATPFMIRRRSKCVVCGERRRITVGV